MRCHPPKGRPIPSISWLQNDRPIDPNTDKNFIVTGEGHLIFVAARLSDTNNYTCVAENVASKRFSDPATITVYGKPLFLLFKVNKVEMVVEIVVRICFCLHFREQ